LRQQLVLCLSAFGKSPCEVADLLGRRSVAPNNLRAAVGLGIPELVDACFQSDGRLTPEACAARGFYRPHSGFPDWQPSTDPQQVLDEALVWACKSNRLPVLERLVRAGALLNADPYRGTPLIWAAACNRTEAVAWLLDRGANINQKGTFGELTHGQGHSSPPGFPERAYASGQAPDRARHGSIHQRRSLPVDRRDRSSLLRPERSSRLPALAGRLVRDLFGNRRKWP
jgi:Ankyrin repeats (3 copies)